MAFAKKIMGFPSDLVSFSTKLPAKRHEKMHVTFFTGIIGDLNLCVFFSILLKEYQSWAKTEPKEKEGESKTGNGFYLWNLL